MKKFFLFSALIACFGACAATQSFHERTLAGSWAMPPAATGEFVSLKFTPDHRFEMDADGIPGPEVEGRWWMDNDVLTILADAEKTKCSSSKAGLYRLHFSGNELRFEFISDDCPSRIEFFSKRWYRR